MGAGAVPVALDGLGVEGGDDAELLSEPVEQPAGDHDHVAEVGGADGADLVLPLSGHDLGVDAGDGEAGLDAGVEVGLSEAAAVDGLGAHSTVEGALGGGVSASGPPEGASVLLEHGVLLLKAEERGGLNDIVGQELDEGGAGVGLVGLAVGGEDVAHDEDVGGAADGVGEDVDGAEDAVGVVALGLAGGGAVEGTSRGSRRACRR